MSFLKPTIEQTSYWEIETNIGTEIIPTDIQDYPETQIDAYNLDDFQDTFAIYLEGSEVYSAEYRMGYLWRLSAPGYLDSTAWSASDTLENAVGSLLETYGDSFDESDHQTLASYLDNFDEFWNGYLLALAFTGSKCDDEPSDIETRIRKSEPDSLSRILGDCIEFYLSALPLIGDEYEQAGIDFHFTRNGHGCGFWDGDWPEHGEELTKLAKPYGPCELEECHGELFVLIG